MQLPAWLQDPAPMAVTLLVASRLGGLLLSAPFFGERGLLGRARVALLVPLAVIVAGAWIQRPDPEVARITAELGRAGLPELAILCLGEALIGLALGLCARVVLAAAAAAGSIIAFQAGLTMANSLDANFETQPLLDVLLSMMVLMLFLGLDLHHAMLRVVADSLLPLPPGGFRGLGTQPILACKAMFEAGFQLAVPILAVLLLVEVVMGFVQKAGPELQLLIVVMPARLGFGLIVLGICMGFWKGLLEGLATDSVMDMQRMVQQMARF